MTEKFVQILVAQKLPFDLIYKLCEQDVMVGDFVKININNRIKYGIIYKFIDKNEINFPLNKIKTIICKIDIPPVRESTLVFLDKVAKYNICDISEIVKMLLSIEDLEFVKTKSLYYFNKTPAKLTPLRKNIINFIKIHDGVTFEEINEATNASKATINILVKNSCLLIKEVQIKEDLKIEQNLKSFHPILSESQAKAVSFLKEQLDQDAYNVTLIDGVTGSGKTEVYFEIIEQAYLKQKNNMNSQILILVPEIILTAQLITRFKKRFGCNPVIWHSSISKKHKRIAWFNILSGDARIIIGTRSAIFLPYKNLSLMIIDEEHDGSYKQEEKTIYNGRDMAILRAYIENFSVIPASATPSLETVNNVNNKKYKKVKLAARFNANMPDIEIIDMRENKKKNSKISWLSEELCQNIEETLAQGKQVILFLNRRGYAPITLCLDCGNKLQCKYCSSYLVRHEDPDRLICHLCGYKEIFRDFCKECKKSETLVSCGPGVQKVTAVIKQKWPQAETILIDSDHITSDKQRDEIIAKITAKKVDIVIGTQILAKGHHFPSLASVGIIDADIGLLGGDLRAAEKCYQLLHQVAGRAGRESDKSKVLIQTYMPDNNVIKALAGQDRDRLIDSELLARQIINMPPFSRLVAIIINCKDKDFGYIWAKKFVKQFNSSNNIEIMGPIAAPIFLIRNFYRYRILIKAELNINIQKYLKNIIDNIEIPKNIKLKIDVDPYYFS